jgi:predicted transcriptional regulator
MESEKKFTFIAYHFINFILGLYSRINRDIKISFDEMMIVYVVAHQWLYNMHQSDLKSFEDMSKAAKKDLDIYNLKDTKLTILSISNALSQPKETTRRRVQKLIDYKLLDKNDDGGIVLGENYNQIINANAKKTTQELAKFFRVMKKTWSDDELNDIASGKLDF